MWNISNLVGWGEIFNLINFFKFLKICVCCMKCSMVFGEICKSCSKYDVYYCLLELIF